MYVMYNKEKILRKSIHGFDTNFEAGELCFNSGTQPDTPEELEKLKENFKIGASTENLRIATDFIQVTDKKEIQRICNLSKIKVDINNKKIIKK